MSLAGSGARLDDPTRPDPRVSAARPVNGPVFFNTRYPVVHGYNPSPIAVVSGAVLAYPRFWSLGYIV